MHKSCSMPFCREIIIITQVINFPSVFFPTLPQSLYLKLPCLIHFITACVFLFFLLCHLFLNWTIWCVRQATWRMRTAVHVVRNELGQNTSVRRAAAAAARSRSNQLAPHKQQAKFYNLQRIANIFMAKYVKHLTSPPAPAPKNTHTHTHVTTAAATYCHSYSSCFPLFSLIFVSFGLFATPTPCASICSTNAIETRCVRRAFA